ncbi:FliM/FliN family flagellar motor switch protein [Herbaspirillum rubrisubalbicans]|uniref:FliM/FliN family flagellar motor switch protein n=1 Tax=Herbaspirillum rubrisubalbicans TaxID=80842 RepID=UPI0021ACFA12|nr:FliM/FliN family flagellar motor switch protein [Herbaspirillum rubrisubalbicans]
MQLLNLSALDTPSRGEGGSALKPGGATNPLHNIRTRLTVCIGSAEISVGELMNARVQQVLRLDQSIEQSVDILLEGQVVARGQLVAVDDYFGVRITELPVTLSA